MCNKTMFQGKHYLTDPIKVLKDKVRKSPCHKNRTNKNQKLKNPVPLIAKIKQLKQKRKTLEKI